MFDEIDNKNFAELEDEIERFLKGEDLSAEEIRDRIQTDELYGIISNREANLLLDRLIGKVEELEDAEEDSDAGFSYDYGYEETDGDYGFEEGEQEEPEHESGFLGIFEDHQEESYNFEEGDAEGDDEETEEGFFSLCMEGGAI